MKTVYLVRHGESETNAGGLILGGMVTKLTERGREQARFVAQRCSHLPIDIIISSPYLRTKDTAEIIAETVEKPIEFSDLFVEWNRGAHRIGKKLDDPEIARHDDLLFAHMSEPNWRMADEENFEDLNARAAFALTFLENRPEEHVLLVGHGVFSRVLIGRVVFGKDFTGRELRHFIHGFQTSNTGISVIEYRESSADSTWSVQTWNDHAHLG